MDPSTPNRSSLLFHLLGEKCSLLRWILQYECARIRLSFPRRLGCEEHYNQGAGAAGRRRQQPDAAPITAWMKVFVLGLHGVSHDGWRAGAAGGAACGMGGLGGGHGGLAGGAPAMGGIEEVGQRRRCSRRRRRRRSRWRLRPRRCSRRIWGRRWSYGIW